MIGWDFGWDTSSQQSDLWAANGYPIKTYEFSYGSRGSRLGCTAFSDTHTPPWPCLVCLDGTGDRKWNKAPVLQLFVVRNMKLGNGRDRWWALGVECRKMFLSLGPGMCWKSATKVNAPELGISLDMVRFNRIPTGLLFHQKSFFTMAATPCYTIIVEMLVAVPPPFDFWLFISKPSGWIIGYRARSRGGASSSLWSPVWWSARSLRSWVLDANVLLVLCNLCISRYIHKSGTTCDIERGSRSRISNLKVSDGFRRFNHLFVVGFPCFSVYIEDPSLGRRQPPAKRLNLQKRRRALLQLFEWVKTCTFMMFG